MLDSNPLEANIRLKITDIEQVGVGVGSGGGRASALNVTSFSTESSTFSLASDPSPS